MDKSIEAGKGSINSGSFKCFTMGEAIESCAGGGKGCWRGN